MKISESGSRKFWYELIKDAKPGSFIAVSEDGWRQVKKKLGITPSDLKGAFRVIILGYPVKVVGDIPDDEIEVRHLDYRKAYDQR